MGEARGYLWTWRIHESTHSLWKLKRGLNWTETLAIASLSTIFVVPRHTYSSETHNRWKEFWRQLVFVPYYLSFWFLLSCFSICLQVYTIIYTTIHVTFKSRLTVFEHELPGSLMWFKPTIAVYLPLGCVPKLDNHFGDIMDQTRSSWREEAVLQMTFDVKQRRRGLFTPTKGEGFGSRGAGQLGAGGVHLQLLPTSSEHAHLDVPRHVKHQPVNPRKCVMDMHLLMPMDLAGRQGHC